MCAQLKASFGLTPQPGGGSNGVVEPLPEGMKGEVPKELVNELPNEAALKPRPALDENEFSIGVMGFGVVEMDDRALLPYTELSRLGPPGC